MAGLFFLCEFPRDLAAQTPQAASQKLKSHPAASVKHFKGKKKKHPKKHLKKKNKKRKRPSDVFIPKDSAHWKPIQIFKEKKRPNHNAFPEDASGRFPTNSGSGISSRYRSVTRSRFASKERRRFKSALFVRQIEHVVEKIKNKKTKKTTLRKVLKGHRSLAQVFAAFYGSPRNGELIVSLFPKSLKELRKHLEFRFLISQGRLVKVEPVMVSILGPNQKEEFLDSHQLDKRKIGFNENYASSGKIFISHLNIHDGKKTLNSASLEMAAFGEDAILGNVSAEFSLRGLPYPQK